MLKQLDIWFPNYKNNPGIVSKELKSQISTLIQNFSAEVVSGRYADFERFMLELQLDNPEYQEYIFNTIEQKLGGFSQPSELKKDDIILGRTFSPGKVGFGIFVDIGIRQNNEQNDALLPLFQLREDLAVDDLSTREIVKMLGLVDGYPLPVIIDSIELEPKIKIDVRLEDNFIETLLDWSEEDKERLIITKTLQSSVKKQVSKLGINKFIDGIYSIDPLTTIVVCDNKTNASGLLPKLGSRLKKSPIGIFHP